MLLCSITNILEPTRGLIVPTKIYTNKTLRIIVCFQRQIRKNRLALLARNRLFSVRYYCQKKAMLLITLLEKLVTLHHRPPTRALWEISTGELVFITADDQIAAPYFAQNSRASWVRPWCRLHVADMFYVLDWAVSAQKWPGRILSHPALVN